MEVERTNYILNFAVHPVLSTTVHIRSTVTDLAVVRSMLGVIARMYGFAYEQLILASLRFLHTGACANAAILTSLSDYSSME